jgi:hypothetical protein
MSKLFVSIVTFDMADDFARTLLSVRNLNKLGYDISCIVVNGNPGDFTDHLIKENSDLIYSYISERDSGIYDAMNKCVSLLPSVGYNIFINSGDIIIALPDFDSYREEYDFISCCVISYDVGSGLNQIFHTKNFDLTDPSFLLNPPVHHQGFFFKSINLRKLRFNLKVGIRADVLIMIDYMQNFKFGIFLPLKVSIITTGGASDNYSIANLMSFYKVGELLKFTAFAIFFNTIFQHFKYLIKFLLGSVGISVIRKFKKIGGYFVK